MPYRLRCTYGRVSVIDICVHSHTAVVVVTVVAVVVVVVVVVVVLVVVVVVVVVLVPRSTKGQGFHSPILCLGR